MGVNPRIEKDTCHLLIEPSFVAIVIRNSLLRRASRNFMRAVGLSMIRAAVLNAGLPASNLGVVVAAVFAIVDHVRCILRFVQVVGTRRKFRSSHVTTGLYTAAIASSLKVSPSGVVVVRRAGSPHE